MPLITGCASRHLRVHRTGLDAAEVTEIDGHPVTTLTRTVLDLARVLPPQEAIAVANAGESFSRLVLHQPGLPPPLLQRPCHGPDGTFLGIPDFTWLDERMIGEFDGRLKYDGRYGPTQDVVMGEKAREQGLRAAGWGVARWGWSDLFHPDKIVVVWRAEARRVR